MKDLCIIKLGGSVITEKGKPFTERLDVISRLAKEIHEARQEKDFALIVGHGGGSYPHVPATEFRTNEGVKGKESYEGIARVQDAAARLNRIIVRELIEAGENAISVQLSSTSISENGRIKDMYTLPMKMMLDYNMVPVPYGDVGLDTQKGCCILSTEEIINYLTKHSEEAFPSYRLNRIIIGGRVDGVFTGNPDTNHGAELIPVITTKNIDQVGQYLAESSGIDVTGGMRHKIESMLELAERGIESEIINVLKPGYLKKALLGEQGLGTYVRKE
ncbi:MAG: isopentenyl phosphate kinase family protein [Candidatus Diapherotrites archaeon]|nr:isopentenyl phosphate kinase family protein [Candidatus Diapherotrites archaeon]